MNRQEADRKDFRWQRQLDRLKDKERCVISPKCWKEIRLEQGKEEIQLEWTWLWIRLIILILLLR